MPPRDDEFIFDIPVKNKDDMLKINQYKFINEEVK